MKPYYNTKVLLIIFLVFTWAHSFSQSKYISQTGIVSFEASVSSFEEVKATNNSVTAILNDKGAFAALVLVKGFRFKNALMEEHFNENYAESDKFPKATFKGTLKSFSIAQIKTNSLFSIDGVLSFHGKTKTVEALPLKLSKVGDVINLTGTFNVKASDFDIKIPNLVKNKVSETIQISVNFSLEKNED